MNTFTALIFVSVVGFIVAVPVPEPVPAPVPVPSNSKLFPDVSSNNLVSTMEVAKNRNRNLRSAASATAVAIHAAVDDCECDYDYDCDYDCKCDEDCVPRPYRRPNCGCVALGACSREAGLYTREVLHKSDMVCGLRFETCCYEGVWPGVEDDFARAAQCVPQEQCVRPYGILPTDVSEFGIIIPCPGYGAVRCILAGNGGGFVAGLPAPSSVVIPIVGTETSGISLPSP